MNRLKNFYFDWICEFVWMILFYSFCIVICLWIFFICILVECILELWCVVIVDLWKFVGCKVLDLIFICCIGWMIFFYFFLLVILEVIMGFLRLFLLLVGSLVYFMVLICSFLVKNFFKLKISVCFCFFNLKNFVYKGSLMNLLVL